MVKPKPKLKRKGLIPPSILALIVALLFVASAVSIVSAQIVKNHNVANQKPLENSECATISTWNANKKTATKNGLKLSPSQDLTIKTDTDTTSSSAVDITEKASASTKKGTDGLQEMDTCTSISTENKDLNTGSSSKENSVGNCSKESQHTTSTETEATTDQTTSSCGSETSDTDNEPQTSSAHIAKESTSKVDPNGCEAKGMWWRADNYECIPKPQPVATTAQASVAAAPATSGGSGSCEAEIAKYNWNHGVALAVARAESGLNPGSLNNNPATGDYSVGCFQVNIYGANARNRPSEAALKNAATNVQWAYNNYVANGHSFIGQWGVCGSKVSCY